MRYSKSLLRTMREHPSNCEVPSHILMYRTGMVKQESSGLFTYLPFFNMILRKVEDAIRKEMQRLNVQECKFPILVSKDVLDESGRWTAFGNEMFSLKDRHGNAYALSPTNEEAAALVAKTYVNSFRDLPLNVYQINTKHRDEIRPRGIGRTRAFTMKDAYSFHASEECLDQTYQEMVDGYVRLFKKLGLTAFPVNADNGSMGGSGSQEVMAISNEGDDEVARCSKCGYAGNLEVVPCVDNGAEISDKKGNYTKHHTPHVGSIDELVGFFNTDATKFAKSMVYKTDDDRLVVVVVRGDREVNEVKVRNLMAAKSVELSSAADIESIGSCVGYVGPIGLDGVRILVDYEVKEMEDFIIGANEKDYHYTNVNCLDFSECEFADVRMAMQGDAHCCGGTFDMVRAIELGHCFKLGKRYTEKLNVTYSDSDNQQKTMTMGCYGIGLERTVSAIIDQYHDDKGIAWPLPIAPITVNVIPTGKHIPQIAEDIHDQLCDRNIDVLLDDRKASAGVKFKDSDLLGIPLKVIVGRSYDKEGMIEIEYRSGEKESVLPENLIARIEEIIRIETDKFYAN